MAMTVAMIMTMVVMFCPRLVSNPSRSLSVLQRTNTVQECHTENV